jgi:hypothetical protein
MDPLALTPTTATAPPTTTTAVGVDVPAITPVDGGTAWGEPAAVSGAAAGNAAVATGFEPTSSITPNAQVQLTLAQALAQQLVAQNVAPTQSSIAAAVSTTLPQVANSTASALAGFASATGKVASSAANVAGAGIARAKQVGSELWAGIRNPKSVHVTQVPSKFNPKPAAGNRDCGPTSVVIALGMLGKSIPGTSAKSSAQAKIDGVRKLAGSPDNTRSTSNLELEQALKAAGASSHEVNDLASIKAAITSGSPVILNGNPRAPGAYGRRFTSAQMTPYNGAHWITVTGFDEASGKFIINDPLAKTGPVKVSAEELEAYRGGSLGIAVSA